MALPVGNNAASAPSSAVIESAYRALLCEPDPIVIARGGSHGVEGGVAICHDPSGGYESNFVASSEVDGDPMVAIAAGRAFFGPRGQRHSLYVSDRTHGHPAPPWGHGWIRDLQQFLCLTPFRQPRPASASDVSIVLGAIATDADLLTWQKVNAAGFDVPWIECQDHLLPTACLDQPNLLLLGAWIGTDFVGTASYYKAGDYAVIRDVCVRRKWRGRGVAGRMMDYLARYALENDCRHGLLTTTAARLSLYAAWGFEPVLRLTRYAPSNLWLMPGKTGY